MSPLHCCIDGHLSRVAIPYQLYQDVLLDHESHQIQYDEQTEVFHNHLDSEAMHPHLDLK
jgi:hypothetical protein